jgi:hypothetical protein
MKKFFVLCVFLALSATFVSAQGNGNNGNGNAWGNGQWANSHWPGFVINWLQNGGQVPVPLAVMVIHEGRTWGMSNFGLSQGQMIQKYATGQLTIEFVSTSPPSLTFRISYSGSIGIVVLQDI